MSIVDVIVVGAGPAGLSAAITLASEGRSVVVLERGQRCGGQAGTTTLIENLLPFHDGLTGGQLADGAARQCRKFGAELHTDTEAVAVLPQEDESFIVLSNHGEFYGRSVVLAVGLNNRQLGVLGDDLPGVHYGMNTSALDCPSGRSVVLVGGGNSAGQAALYYLQQGASVVLVARYPLEATMSDYLVRRLEGKVGVLLGQVTRFRRRAGGLVVVVDYHFRLDADCVHVFVGQQPGTEWLDGLVLRDERGYIWTDEQYQTLIPGLFAVGDVVQGAVHRVNCAIGAGGAVVPAVHRYLEEENAAN